MGGMAAQIPIKNNAEANEQALEKVRQDKLREAQDGHDGTWVAHPALVPIAKEIFDTHMPNSNQISKKREDVQVSREDLLAVPTGERTEAGLRQNINVGLQYLAAWVSGNGCVPLHHLMEDAATAEISRTQIWQWLKHKATLNDGRTVTRDMVLEVLDNEVQKIKDNSSQKIFSDEALESAKKLFVEVSVSDECVDFLTVPAYEVLTSN